MNSHKHQNPKTKAIIIHVIHKDNFFSNSAYKLEEAKNLAKSINLIVADSLLIELTQFKASTFIGSGKIEEIP